MGKVKAIPEGMHSVTPSLTIDGAAKAIDWYKRALGAEEMMRAPDPSGQKIWHASIRIGDSVVFVGDAFPDMGGGALPTRLWLYVDGVDAAWKRCVDAGAKVKMPLGDMFWGDRMGTVVDPFGNEWSLAQRIKELTPEEMKQAQDEAVAQMKKSPPPTR